MLDIAGGDDRYYNNIFIAHEDLTGLSKHDTSVYPVYLDGNVFLKGLLPSVHEEAPLQLEEFDPEIKLSIEEDGVYLQFTFDLDWKNEKNRKLVTTELLNRTHISQLPFKDTDGTQISISMDYLGEVRDCNNPYPGPFEITSDERQRIKVWPVK